MASHDCPPREELSQYVLGALTPQRLEAIAEHLESCPSCDVTMDELEHQGDSAFHLFRELGDCNCAVEGDSPIFADTKIGTVPEVVASAGEVDFPEVRRAIEAAKAVGPGVGAHDSACSHDTLKRELQAPGQCLGDYELLETRGEGGMGTVFKARHLRLDKIVALKVLPKRRTSDPRAIARFEREMKAVGRLSHPHIVQAHDARDIDGTTVLVMEYVEGLDLGKLIRRVGPLPVADACELIRQTALGLQYISTSTGWCTATSSRRT